MARTGWGTSQNTFTKGEKTMKASGDNTVYYGRYSCNGELVGAGKFIDYVLCLYGRDGKFHYDQRYDKMYYEGEFDEITEEEFLKFKEEMDLLGKAERKVKMTLNTTKTEDQNSGEK